MHRPAFFGFARTVLTVVGIGLLIIFGVRAASQASSLTAVGGSEAKRSRLPITNVNRLATTLGTMTGKEQSPLSSQSTIEENTDSPVPKKHASPSLRADKTIASISRGVERVTTDTNDHVVAKGPHVK